MKRKVSARTCWLGVLTLLAAVIATSVPPGLGMYCLAAKGLLEPADDDVCVVAIEFNAIPASPGFLGRDQGRSAAGKRIDDDAPALGAIQNRIGNLLFGQHFPDTARRFPC